MTLYNTLNFVLTSEFLCPNAAGRVGCPNMASLPKPFLLVIFNTEPKKAKRAPPSQPWKPCDKILCKKSKCMSSGPFWCLSLLLSQLNVSVNPGPLSSYSEARE